MTLGWLYAVAFFLVCLAFGGGTRHGGLADPFLQLAALPLLAGLVLARLDLDAVRSRRVALTIGALLLAVPLVQLAPLSSGLATTPAAAAGLAVQRSQLSLTPHATMLSALSLLPPIAIMLAVATMPATVRRTLVLVLVAFATLNVFIGILQVAQGPESPLRFYGITNLTEAVGVFANRNHLSALTYCALVFAICAVLISTSAMASQQDSVRQRSIMPWLILGGALTVIVLLVIAQIFTRSRGGLGLMAMAFILSAILAVRTMGRTAMKAPVRLLALAMCLAVGLAAQYGAYRLIDRLDLDLMADARVQYGQATLAAARAYLPFGSGVGSFTTVFGQYESRDLLLSNIYANHAHNDVFELLLETGVLGGLVVLVLSAAGLVRVASLWRRAPRNPSFDRLLPLAASIVLFLLVLHSFVDYPLRTTALMAVFGACAGMLIAPNPAGAMAHTQPVSKSRRQAQAPAAAQAAAPFKPQPAHPAPTWGAAEDWPEEWRKPPKGPGQS